MDWMMQKDRKASFPLDRKVFKGIMKIVRFKLVLAYCNEIILCTKCPERA